MTERAFSWTWGPWAVAALALPNLDISAPTKDNPMKIIIQTPPPGEGDSATISVRTMSDKINRAIDILKSPEGLTVFADQNALVLPLRDVFYVESVDLKTFVYAEKNVYRSRLKLYEVEALLADGDFLRISKQAIVNIRKIRSVAPAGAGCFSATLLNGEKIIISRQYAPAMKGRFGL